MKSLLLIYLLVFCGCAIEPYATELAKTWMDPFATMTENADDKVLVVALVKDEPSRRAIESEVVRFLDGHAIASFAVLQNSAVSQDNDRLLRNVLTSGDYTHVLLMRITDTQNDACYVPGVNSGIYANYNKYYNHSARNYTDAHYFKTNGKYCFEVMVYKVDPNELVWAGISTSVNTSNFERVAVDIADMITSEMRIENFIK